MARNLPPEVKAKHQEYIERSKKMQDEHVPEIIAAGVIQQIEQYRQDMLMPMGDLCKIVGLCYNSYYEFRAGTRPLPLRSFLLFCLTFGYDISGIVETATMQSTKAPLRELGTYLGQLSNDTLKKINQVIQNSYETPFMKRRGEALINEVKSNEPHISSAFDEISTQNHVAIIQDLMARAK